MCICASNLSVHTFAELIQKFRASGTPAHTCTCRMLVCAGDVCGKREGLGNMAELGSVDWSGWGGVAC